MARRLVITATPAGFLAETEYSYNGVDWSCLSRTHTEKFPLVIVGLVAGRDDYRIFVRAHAKAL